MMGEIWMKTQNKLLFFVACLLVLTPLYSVPSFAKNKEIKIAQFGDFYLYAPLYIAIDAGFFEKKGLSVKLINTGGDEKTWAAVLSGDVSFGVADPTFVAVSAERGKPGIVIASIVNGVPFWGVTYNKKIPSISSPSELSGLTIATFPAPSTAYSLQKKMFLSGGLKPSIRQGAFGALLPMIRTGQADIALELEPNVSQAMKSGARVVYSMKDIYGDFAITGLTVSPDFANKNQELIGKVVCAVQYALDYLHKHPKESVSLLLKRFPEIDRTVALDALTRVLKEKIIPENTIISKKAWKKAVELRVEIGDIKDAGEFNTYVDNKFAKEAAKNCRIK